MKKLTSDAVWTVVNGLLTTPERVLNEQLDRLEETGKRVPETDSCRLETARALAVEATKLRVIEAAERYDKRSRLDWKNMVTKIVKSAEEGSEHGLNFPMVPPTKITLN